METHDILEILLFVMVLYHLLTIFIAEKWWLLAYNNSFVFHK